MLLTPVGGDGETPRDVLRGQGGIPAHADDNETVTVAYGQRRLSGTEKRVLTADSRPVSAGDYDFGDDIHDQLRCCVVYFQKYFAGRCCLFRRPRLCCHEVAGVLEESFGSAVYRVYSGVWMEAAATNPDKYHALLRDKMSFNQEDAEHLAWLTLRAMRLAGQFPSSNTPYSAQKPGPWELRYRALISYVEHAVELTQVGPCTPSFPEVKDLRRLHLPRTAALGALGKVYGDSGALNTAVEACLVRPPFVNLFYRGARRATRCMMDETPDVIESVEPVQCEDRSCWCFSPRPATETWKLYNLLGVRWNLLSIINTTGSWTELDNAGLFDEPTHRRQDESDCNRDTATRDEGSEGLGMRTPEVVANVPSTLARETSQPRSPEWDRLPLHIRGNLERDFRRLQCFPSNVVCCPAIECGRSIWALMLVKHVDDPKNGRCAEYINSRPRLRDLVVQVNELAESHRRLWSQRPRIAGAAVL